MTTVPLVPQYGELGKVYLDAWYDVAVEKRGVENNQVSGGLISHRWEKEYGPRLRTLVKPKQPADGPR